MHIKCLPRGTGSARAAVDHLVGERDAAGQVRACVEVLRGNRDHVAAVADSLEFEHNYRSLVIAWAPEDRPTEAQIGAVLDEFEKRAWAGLEPDRYAWTAVLHEQGGGVHVHVLTARCDLETGRGTAASRGARLSVALLMARGTAPDLGSLPFLAGGAANESADPRSVSPAMSG